MNANIHIIINFNKLYIILATKENKLYLVIILFLYYKEYNIN